MHICIVAATTVILFALKKFRIDTKKADSPDCDKKNQEMAVDKIVETVE